MSDHNPVFEFQDGNASLSVTSIRVPVLEADPWTTVALLVQCHQPTSFTSFDFLRRGLHATLKYYVVKWLSFSIVLCPSTKLDGLNTQQFSVLPRSFEFPAHPTGDWNQKQLRIWSSHLFFSYLPPPSKEC